MSSGLRTTIIKALIIGNQSAGKTSFIKCAADRRYSSKYDKTLDFDFLTTKVSIDERLFLVQLWDSAGSSPEKFPPEAFLQTLHCCILSYDVTSRESFEALGKWHEALITNARLEHLKTIPVVVLGCKADGEGVNQKVTEQQASTFAGSVGSAISYIASARDGTNVGATIEGIVRHVLKHENTLEFHSFIDGKDFESYPNPG